ncbi:glycosyltransferase [Devosia sp.]|uniref:glycosyltransferase n=1 Tax=Devosia sp. TaxID=1871048 RepID=UPI001AC0EE37|nr:glycosyltransferase [Devosia sp.]MBN9309597.1 glycosyltransferase [Devosia sp.]
MRIYIAHNAYQQQGGEDAVVAAEAELLRSAGHDVSVGLVSNNDIHSRAAKVRAFFDAPHSARRAAWIGEELQRTGAEILHVHNFFPLLTPAIHEEAARRGIAVVQTLHNYRLLCAGATFLRDGQLCEKCLGDRRHWGVVHRCYRGSLPGSLAVYRMQERSRHLQVWQRRVHRFIALSEFARSKFVEGGFPADRIVVKPNFVAPYSGPLPASRHGALFVGRLAREKGVDVLLDAWRQLPDLPLTIVGDGPDRDRLIATAPPNVTFTGTLSHPEVEARMLSAAILVVPSIWYEGFGMVVAEAFARGLPVVASRIGSLPEVFGPSGQGALFEPGDREELVRAVLANLSGPDARRMRERQLALFSPAAALRQLEDIYSDARAASDAENLRERLR